ncbi:MAG: hypothetical protein K6G42_08650 [Lachnospiraceae bacterium]|nr:hypothetical protein [Lachnospiraceae bacterium]
MKKNIIRIGCFLVILAIVLGYCNSVLKLKDGDGIYDMALFYELDENSVDVLILGSSHAFEHFNTGTLWDEHGLASYILSGSRQPMWNTYYYLKESLKTQRPKLIVLEAYGTVFTDDYEDDVRIIKNNFGLRWSPDKVRSLLASVPAGKRSEFFLEYIQYHSRYKELTRGDFLEYQGNPLYQDWKGYGCNTATVPWESKDISGVTDRAELSGKTEEYYRATIELAKKNDIPVLVVITPYPGIKAEEEMVYNKAGDIAQELGVPFLNCNLKVNDIGLDFSVDSADNEHLNYRGSQKFSSYIGKYITDNYALPDHRGEAEYDSWERHADFIRQQIYDQEVAETTDAATLFEKIKNDRFLTAVSIDGTCNTSEPAISGYLNTLGITEENAAGIWLYEGGNQVWYSGAGENSNYRQIGSHDHYLKRVINEDGSYTDSVTIDFEEYSKVEDGINVVVYDTLTEKVADCFGLSTDEGYKLIR